MLMTHAPCWRMYRVFFILPNDRSLFALLRICHPAKITSAQTVILFDDAAPRELLDNRKTESLRVSGLLANPGRLLTHRCGGAPTQGATRKRLSRVVTMLTAPVRAFARRPRHVRKRLSSLPPFIDNRPVTRNTLISNRGQQPKPYITAVSGSVSIRKITPSYPFLFGLIQSRRGLADQSIRRASNLP